MAEAPESIMTWLSLMRAHAAVLDTISHQVEPAIGMPLGWLEVLHQLSLAPPEGLRMRDLARSVLITRSGFTRLADRLEREGLVERAACPIDRRGWYLTLTAAGRDALERGRPAFREAIERNVTAHLTHDEELMLRRALDKLTAANPSDRVACVTETDKSVDAAATVASTVR